MAAFNAVVGPIHHESTAVIKPKAVGAPVLQQQFNIFDRRGTTSRMGRSSWLAQRMLGAQQVVSGLLVVMAFLVVFDRYHNRIE